MRACSRHSGLHVRTFRLPTAEPYTAQRRSTRRTYPGARDLGRGMRLAGLPRLRLDVRSAARKQSEDVQVTVLLPSDIEAYGYPNDADPSPDLPARPYATFAKRA